MTSSTIIALAKGELGKQIENYISRFGICVNLDGRPLAFEQRTGNRIFRPMQSKDVPWYVAQSGDYGITGQDLVKEYMTGNNWRIKVVERLGFGKADLVLFAKEKRDPRGEYRVAVPYYYRNLASRLFPEYTFIEVSGSTEGFVLDGSADFGIDVTTYLMKPENERNKTTLGANGLKIVEKIMPTEAVLISKNSPDYTMEGFQAILQNGSN